MAASLQAARGWAARSAFTSSLTAVSRAPARLVHSKRALKRMRGHPSGWERRGYTPREQPEPQPLRWTPAEVTATPSGWIAPTGQVPVDLPFGVARTSVGQQLPVYRDYRNGRTRIITQVRKMSGDKQVAADEMSKVCGGATVETKQGRLEVVGDYAVPVKLWLAGLGF